MNELMMTTLKDSIGKIICFRKLNHFYFEGLLLAVDESFLKYDDRKKGITLCPLEEVREVEFK